MYLFTSLVFPNLFVKAIAGYQVNFHVELLQSCHLVGTRLIPELFSASRNVAKVSLSETKESRCFYNQGTQIYVGSIKPDYVENSVSFFHP